MANCCLLSKNLRLKKKKLNPLEFDWEVVSDSLRPTLWVNVILLFLSCGKALEIKSRAIEVTSVAYHMPDDATESSRLKALGCNHQSCLSYSCYVQLFWKWCTSLKPPYSKLRERLRVCRFETNDVLPRMGAGMGKLWTVIKYYSILTPTRDLNPSGRNPS